MRVLICMNTQKLKEETILARLKSIENKFAELEIPTKCMYNLQNINENVKKDMHSVTGILEKIGPHRDFTAVYFADGWIHSRDCRLVHAFCQEFGIKILPTNFIYWEASPIMPIPDVTRNIELPSGPNINKIDPNDVVRLVKENNNLESVIDLMAEDIIDYWEEIKKAYDEEYCKDVEMTTGSIREFYEKQNDIIEERVSESLL